MTPLRVIFWTASWCGPCLTLKKSATLEKAVRELRRNLCERHPGVSPIDVALVIRDVDQFEESAEANEVQAMPTVDLWRDLDTPDGEPKEERVSRIVGAYSQKTYVSRWLKALGEK